MGELRQRGKVWWIRYYRNGRRHEESSGSTTKQAATDLLKIREEDVARGVPVSAKVGQIRFEEGAADLVNEYRINGRRSLDVVERRIRLHLQPWFGGRRLASITTVDVRSYVTHRREQEEVVRGAYERTRKDGSVCLVAESRRPIPGASNAEINRELTILKRIFSLAIQAGKLMHKPYVPLLKETNARAGFFEHEQFVSVIAHLPPPLRPAISFAYITGWRVASEILPLERRQVDFAGGEVRLDPGTTKNSDGRVFPLTDDLRRILEAQKDHADRLQRERGQIVPGYFSESWPGDVAGRRLPNPFVASTRRGRRRLWRRAARDASRTTSGAQPSGTWSGEAFQSAWRCS